MWFLLLGCLGSAFALSWGVTRYVQTAAPRWGLVDQPGHRKVHVTPTPMGGGIAIWFGVVLPLLGVQVLAWVFGSQETPPDWLPSELAVHLEGVLYRSGQLWFVLAGATALFVMGLVDDLKGLSWQLRLGLQFVVAIFLVLVAGVQATVFVPLPWVGTMLTVLWILVLVNALNFLDNMDGLTGGIALVASVVFGIVMLTATGEPRWFVAAVLFLLAGASLGFLCFNWSPASIFLGDSGSYFIGCLLACLTVTGTFYDETSTGRHVMLAPLCILAIPLYDFTTVTFIRLSQGHSPFHGDKNHISHRLVALGLKPMHAVLTIHLATLTTGLGALLLFEVKGWSGAVLVLGLIGCVLAIITILETAGRRHYLNSQSENSSSDYEAETPPS